MSFNETKEAQKRIIEAFGTEPWVKDEIINVIDDPISSIPELDRGQYTVLINSAEHPNGYKADYSVHPVLRIRDGKILRREYGIPDAFFWDDRTYDKNKRKCAIQFRIGTESGELLENYCMMREKLKDVMDCRLLSQKLAFRKGSLEVLVTEAEQRHGLEVTWEVIASLPTLLESYNDWDENAQVGLNVGDLLVLDGNGYYYRVEKSLKEKTYHKGCLGNA